MNAYNQGARGYQETLLVDTLDRMRRNPEGRKVVHLHLSQLVAANRTPVRIKIVTRMFRTLESGRNAQIFRDNGIAVTGIEISKTAIELAGKHYGTEMTIYHGSVTDMPFDKARYDGIFCYALIHLLDSTERLKLIQDCYNQLNDGGFMVFTAISKEASTYGKGQFISKDRYEIFDGVKMFFYDRASIQEEFGKAGLFEITEITESFPFFLIKCKKQ